LARGLQSGSAAQVADDPTTANARDALQKYSAALQSLDANAVKKVQPSINADNLAKAFREMRELKVEIEAVRVLSAEPATMRVSCRVTQTLTPKAGARQMTAVTRVIRLRRDATTWVIDAFER
jgi:hypothetical protein